MIEESGETITTHTGLSLIGLLLDKTHLRTRFNDIVIPENANPDISNAEVACTYVGLLCQGKSDLYKCQEGTYSCTSQGKDRQIDPTRHIHRARRVQMLKSSKSEVQSAEQRQPRMPFPQLQVLSFCVSYDFGRQFQTLLANDTQKIVSENSEVQHMNGLFGSKTSFVQSQSNQGQTGMGRDGFFGFFNHKTQEITSLVKIQELSISSNLSIYLPF